MSERPAASPEQRRAARRTALLVGAVALAIYLAFIGSGMIGR